MSSLRSLSGNAFIYLGSNIINAAIPFILIPVLTRWLTPEEYGTVGMFTIAVSIFATLIGLSTNGAVGVRFFQLSPERHSRFVFNCLCILFATSIASLLLLALFAQSLEVLFSLPSAWLMLAILVAGCQFIINIKLSIWQVKKNPTRYGFFQITQSLANATISVFLVTSLSMGWVGRAWAIAGVSFLAAIVALYSLYSQKEITVHFNKYDVQDALRFGIPLLPHAIGALMAVSIDRLIVSKYLGIGVAGIYIVGLQLGMVIGVLSDALNKAFAPWLMEWLAGEKQDANRIVRLTYIAFFGLLSAAVILSLLVPFILQFAAGEKYREAASIAVYSAFGYAFIGMYYLVTNYVFFHGSTGKLSLISLSTGIVSIGLNFILVQQMGLAGAGLAFLITSVLSFFCTWFLAAYLQPMPWFSARVVHE